MIYAFEDYELDTTRFELRRKGEVCPIERQVFDVLAYLVQNHDRAVTKDEVLDEVWHDRFVGESTLNSRIMAARKAIADNGRDQRLIRTLHGRGYRFVGEVTVRDASTTPPAQRAHTATWQLPGPLTTFVGRRDEVKAALARLEDERCRLLTLVGPGGIGKTRLAIEVANAATESFSDVAFVDLQAVDTGERLLASLAGSLGIPAGLGATVEQIAAGLQSRTALLVLDNADGIVNQAPILSVILQQAEATKIVITSREVLNTAEEWVQAVDSLDFPPAGSNEGLDSYASAELLMSRAQQVSSDAMLEEDHEAVAEICRRMEGIPLALELAAAWTRAMSWREIAEAIRDGTELASRRRDISERHRSMASVFDGSWRRLDKREQQTFARLSVFRGGFTVQAAQAVAGADRELMTRLIEQSLVRRDRSGRFFLHEVLRTFAWSKLEDAADTERTRDAHASWIFDWYGNLAPRLSGHGQFEAMRDADLESDNIREAFFWAVERGTVSGRDSAIIALHLDFGMHGRSKESYDILDTACRALEREPGRSEVTLALATQLSAYHAIILGNVDEAEERLAKAANMMKTLSVHADDWLGWHPSIALGIIALVRGETAKVREHAQACLDAVRTNSHPRLEYTAYYLLAREAIVSGRHDEGREHASRALRLTKAAGDDWFAAMLVSEIAKTSLALSDLGLARSYFQTALEMRGRLQDLQGVAAARSGLGAVAIAEGKPGEAVQNYEASISANRRIGDRGETARALAGRARAAITLGHLDEAAHNLAEALDLATQISFVPAVNDIAVTAGELLIAQGDYLGAVAPLVVAEIQPGSERDTLDRANAALDSLRSCLGDERVEQAADACRKRDPESMLASLLGALDLPSPGV